jgi:tetratricopeptide (TPR) repeat protein/ssDNA-binding Zn-finger/Zn-ribbon topoisomerase 1
MSRPSSKRKEAQKTGPDAKGSPAGPARSPRTKPPRSWFVAGGIGIVFVGVLAASSGLPGLVWSALTGRRTSREAGAVTPATYVGASRCQKCHEKEFRDWSGSHHDLAMQRATPATVLGDFKDAAIEHFGERSEFFTRGGAFMVRTHGPDGKPTEYTITHTFGVYPLQQYLIPFPGGRYQALSIAWDSRTAAEGGQKWFHLYPDEKIDHTDQLHWTGLYQNWNLMCAECHSTNLRKGYDAATNTYKTTYNEINVACESCHGPGSRHAEWAHRARPPYPPGADKGLEVDLRSDWASAWRFEAAGAKFPVRDKPPSAAEVNQCAPCHARRSTIAEGVRPGSPLEDSHRLAVAADPLYYHDGQQRDEVYEWGSFLQSKMHAKGVTCVDCHEPHSLKTRGQGNDVCARCHDPTIFDVATHHFHNEGSPGARCVTCHMPTRTYMVVHDRLDHSIRVPRPDLSPITGGPDACTMCHTDQKPEWAAAAMDRWYPATWRQRPQWGPVLAASATQGAGGTPSLLALAQDPTSPAIVRATAGTLAAGAMRPEDLPVARVLITDAEPSVRIAGLGMLDPFDAPTRAAEASACLSDPVRGVRIEAARLLADVPRESLTPDAAAAREIATGELEASLQLNADWPAENVNAGNLALRRGEPRKAIKDYLHALEMDPRFIGAWVNLADVYRQLGRESDAETVLKRGLSRLPESADLHHSLGLLLIRTGDRDGAMNALAKATTLAQDNARYSYVYAIGLHSAGKIGEAIHALREADAKHPYDPDILGGLVSMLRERGAPGDRGAALEYAKKLAAALPNDPGVAALVKELSASPGGPR